jgi:general L-amino acid transport system permease protein
MRKILSDEKKRGQFYQLVLLIVVFSIAFILFKNTQANLAKQNIASGFGFLSQEAGFEISESIIDYSPDKNYLKALYVGFLNTFKVSLLGNALAIFLGVIIGIGLLTKHVLIRNFCKVYVESLRNIPLLLQLYFWYTLLSELAPSVRQAKELLPNLYLSNRGIVFPIMQEHAIWKYVIFSFCLALLIAFFLNKFNDKSHINTGKRAFPSYLLFALILFIPLLVWLIGGAPTELDLPALRGFNFQGGGVLSPEYMALMLGLVLYTSAFIAEIVRSGIQSVDKGQWEACRSLGFNRFQSMNLVILPQGLRVIIPPLTSQILNLTKNSSLAVAIGYPDFVSIANTSMNQTGQAIEMVALIMIVYLFYSLGTSFFMNWYNKSKALIIK